ncbi:MULTISPECIES: peptidoglycan D,D-transpeptidase FtsI family protein [Frigoribacterium]|uniref:peptidoglycan D,D-transpeptidase FtsI family protein n=1 Tax=Frigoribacterium TaxID=96492 RepID=UPI001565166D|nr:MULTISPECIES: penicillin-binding protein 2 [Frigoribacterium]MBD8486896.1 penicillin-binding protein 2 [Frigoribacterium sp. CFBP 8759]NQW87571.1 penicillin-binding protein 2 [Frigoribacterium sp. VKM Ac-2860]NQX09620.1 penicillin-binding protein 2 [Frigoribacterium sp. VKM Ac-2859]NRD26393.1 penicillin-binding protein 2 [Frigoribacterium sp. VKM Ac-2836]
MNKELRRVSYVVLAMFVALFLSTTYITAFQADALNADARNSRALLASYSAQRGPILVGGQAIAQSTPVDDQYEFQRTYSQPDLYAPVAGYYTLGQGSRGIEDAMNRYLTGNANSQFFDQVNSLLTGQDPEGATVNLTLDPTVQQAAYDALGSNSGSVVAMDPKTGKILAMVSKPSYDPNPLASHDRQTVTDAYDSLIADPSAPLQNRAIQGDLYAPGSTFKLITTAAALESGDYTPDSAFPNPSTLTLPGTSTNINNAEGGSCGGGETATIATALRLSCNIPMAQLGQALGAKALQDQAEKFGFGDDSIGVPQAVTPSQFPIEDSKGQAINDATLMLQSFGQGSDRVTPLQMAMVSSAIANGGTEMNPTLIESVLNPDLSPVEDFSPSEYGKPISSQTAATMTDMMVQDVANGAASNARIDGVDVAGKTGTAENGPGEPYTLWFTGFAPAADPEVAVAVVVENGGGQGQSAFGNSVASPIAKKVLEAVLNK